MQCCQLRLGHVLLGPFMPAWVPDTWDQDLSLPTESKALLGFLFDFPVGTRLVDEVVPCRKYVDKNGGRDCRQR